MDRALIVSAVAGLTAVGLVTAATLDASAQSGRPFRGAVSAADPTGSTVNGTVASAAAYGERAGEGRSSTPTPTETAREGEASAEPSPEFGRPNPGRPGYQDPEFRGDGDARSQSGQPQGGGQNQQAQSGPANGAGDEEEDPTVLTVNDGFFFDNYTSGSGFGVYGGEAVTSGQERQLELPSAALIARNLGLPIGPGQNAAPPTPVQPVDPSID